MDITNNIPVTPVRRLRDVEAGQVFSFENGSSVLLMTSTSKYVRLTDGSVGTFIGADTDRTVKIYEHELVLKAVK